MSPLLPPPGSEPHKLYLDYRSSLLPAFLAPSPSAFALRQPEKCREDVSEQVALSRAPASPGVEAKAFALTVKAQRDWLCALALPLTSARLHGSASPSAPSRHTGPPPTAPRGHSCHGAFARAVPAAWNVASPDSRTRLALDPSTRLLLHSLKL